VAVTEAAPRVAVPAAAPPVRLYEKGSLLRKTGAELRSLIGYRGLVRYLVRSELRSSTTGRWFGFVWWLLDPFLNMGVYVVLVSVILGRGGGAYPVFVFTSVLAFRFFSSGITSAMGRTAGGQGMMKQIRFPPTIFPLSAVITQVFHFAFGLVILLLFAALFGIYPAPIDLLIIPIVGVQFILTLGIAFLLSALNIFMRDIQNLISYVFRVMFFLSPAIYSLDRVPEKYRIIILLNPMTPLFESYHDVVVFQQHPHWVALGLLLVVSTVGLIVSFIGFVRLERLFNKVL
jgi:ABC-type polysaccharide/polyol phosphate export permease